MITDFIVDSLYPILEAISGIHEYRYFDVSHLLWVVSSLILLTAVPNLREWFFDELKVLSTISLLDTNPSYDISKIWDQFDQWQKGYFLNEKEIEIEELSAYLEEIKEYFNI